MRSGRRRRCWEVVKCLLVTPILSRSDNPIIRGAAVGVVPVIQGKVVGCTREPSLSRSTTPTFRCGPGRRGPIGRGSLPRLRLAPSTADRGSRRASRSHSRSCMGDTSWGVVWGLDLPRAPAAGGGMAGVALAGAVAPLGSGGAAAGAAGPWGVAFGFEPAGGAFGAGMKCLAGGH